MFETCLRRPVFLGLSWRSLRCSPPVAEGLNATDAHLRHVWQTFKDAGARTVVLGGLKFADDHVHSFMSYGLPLPTGTFKPGKKGCSLPTLRRRSWPLSLRCTPMCPRTAVPPY
ncbi:hypothetical protein GA0070612_5145 [Micromonospora chokoriensis]|uniref:Uncharacterized protein n=1 Tax=Micromonospora chokoriensis TaxID=356851 RepID=A0A1C4YSW2_9ACTN|nr:hypothetical protein GA0070612_5145 [Micromonospora chokoriensis]